MPAPMMAPMPSMVRFRAVSARLSDRSLVASASARSAATDLVAHKFIGGILFVGMRELPVSGEWYTVSRKRQAASGERVVPSVAPHPDLLTAHCSPQFTRCSSELRA